MSRYCMSQFWLGDAVGAKQEPQAHRAGTSVFTVAHPHIPALAARGHEAPVWAEANVGDPFGVALIGVDACASPDVPHLHGKRGESGWPLQELLSGSWCFCRDVLCLSGVS